MDGDREMVGATFAGYHIETTVGRGATGTVYAARNTEGRRVALKILSPRLAQDQRFRERFSRESELAAGLRHPNIVALVSEGEANGVPYLATDFVDGGDLRTLLLEKGRLPPDSALRIITQIASALDAAHALGLVHRDVKPANILLERDGERAWLCDFGLARHATSADSLAGDRALVGTIAYVAPEQIEGGDIDGRADVYALGCVLFECIGGRPPFERESELAVVYAHLNELPPALAGDVPGVPESLDRVLARAMAKAAADRQATCGALVAEAEAALRGDGPSPRRGGRRRRRGRRRSLTAGAVAVIVAAGAAVVAHVAGPADNGPRTPAPLRIGPSTLSLVDPGSRRVDATLELGGRPWDVAFARGTAFALLGDAHRVVRIDSTTHRILGSTLLPFVPGGSGADGGAMWITEYGGPRVVRVDAAGRIDRRLSVRSRGIFPDALNGVAAGAGSLWLARGNEVVRVDPRDGAVQARFAVPVRATLIGYAAGAVWAASGQTGRIVKLDPHSNRVAATTVLHGSVTDMVATNGSIWVAVAPQDVVYRLSVDDGGVLGALPAGAAPGSISVGGGAVWVASPSAGTITWIQTATSRTRTIPVAGQPWFARYHSGAVWTSAAPGPQLLPPLAGGYEVRVPLSGDISSTDPAWWTDPVGVQLQYATCARLLDYPDAEGTEGRTLRPEIAEAMPEVSTDGRRYTFTLRPGFRFSPPSGAAVTATAYAASLERAFSPGFGREPPPPATRYLSDIVGAKRFAAGRARHITGIVARGNRLTLTIGKPSGSFLARVSMSFFCPVPPGTPAHPGGVDAAPSSGPYYVASRAAGQTVLLPNPGYAGARPRRAGRIVYAGDTDPEAAVALVARGAAEYVSLFGAPESTALQGDGPLERRYGAAAARGGGGPRYLRSAAPGVDSVAFNTTRPLFRDVRLRRAARDALDRAALSKVYGQEPATSLIPRAIVSGATASSTTLSAAGISRARRLAGNRTAVLYWCGDPRSERETRIIARSLVDIGIRVRAESCRGGRPEPLRLRTADMSLVTEQDALIDPEPFVRIVLAEDLHVPSGWWDIGGLRSEIERASRLTGEARADAFARLDAEIVGDRALIAPYSAHVGPEFVSGGTGCVTVQSAYNFVDLGALCARQQG